MTATTEQSAMNPRRSKTIYTNDRGLKPSKSKGQSKGKGYRKWRTCFIAAPMEVDLQIIKEVLDGRGITPLISSDLLSNTHNIKDTITGAIEKADFLVAVFDPRYSNTNVSYELGYAHALGKRVLVFVPPGLKTIPTDILKTPYLRADAKNREALEFALDQTLAIPNATRNKRAHLVVESRPIGKLADELLENLQSIGSEITEQGVIEIITTALQASGISIIVPSDEPLQRPDLAIWVDDLDSWVGNPILIEVKRFLTNHEQVKQLINQMSDYLHKGNSPLALILYVKGLPSATDFIPKNSYPILFLEVREFLDKLKSNSFGQLIRELRNTQVHGSGS